MLRESIASRFPDVIDFDILGAKDYMTLIAKQLDGKKRELARKGKISHLPQTYLIFNTRRVHVLHTHT